MTDQEPKKCANCKFAVERTDEYLGTTRLKCRNKFSPFFELGVVNGWQTCFVHEYPKKKKEVK